MTKLFTVALALLIQALLLSAQDAPKMKMAAPTKAVCVVHHLKDSTAHGVLFFTQKGQEIEITGEIMGLTPGKHGFTGLIDALISSAIAGSLGAASPARELQPTKGRHKAIRRCVRQDQVSDVKRQTVEYRP